MRIWVDADACPRPVKEILYRAADRTGVALTLVANQALQIPSSPNITMIRVSGGFDVADQRIVADIQAGDLVITADIPLAAEAIKNGGHALSPRGEVYDSDNIGQRLSMRNFMDELRGSGVNTGGPAPLNQTDRQTFANALDRFLTRRPREDDEA